jgi:hypothetical protein
MIMLLRLLLWLFLLPQQKLEAVLAADLLIDIISYLLFLLQLGLSQQFLVLADLRITHLLTKPS